MKQKIEGRDYVREIVRKRDNYTCQDCGEKKDRSDQRPGWRAHHVHHLNGLCGKRSRSYDRVADIDGLVTLCHKCHRLKHDKTKYGKRILPKYRFARIRIRWARFRGLPYDKIGKRFGVSGQAVYFYLNGRP